LPQPIKGMPIKGNVEATCARLEHLAEAALAQQALQEVALVQQPPAREAAGLLVARAAQRARVARLVGLQALGLAGGRVLLAPQRRQARLPPRAPPGLTRGVH